jgi:hypothetical protein
MFVLPLLRMRATTSFNRSGLNGRVFTIRRSSMLILVNGAHGIPYQALSPHPTDRPDMAASINNKRTSRNVGYAGSAWDATRVHCQVLDEKLSERKARGGKKSAAIELHRRRLAFEIIREPSQFSIARASPCPLSSWRSIVLGVGMLQVRHADPMSSRIENHYYPAAFVGAPGLISIVLTLFVSAAGFLMLRWRTPLSKCASMAPSSGLKGRDIER